MSDSERSREAVGSRESLLTDGLRLLILSTLVYFCAVNYRSGFCSHFEIPFSLLSEEPKALIGLLAYCFNPMSADHTFWLYYIPAILFGAIFYSDSVNSLIATSNMYFQLHGRTSLRLVGFVILLAYGWCKDKPFDLHPTLTVFLATIFLIGILVAASRRSRCQSLNEPRWIKAVRLALLEFPTPQIYLFMIICGHFYLFEPNSIIRIRLIKYLSFFSVMDLVLIIGINVKAPYDSDRRPDNSENTKMSPLNLLSFYHWWQIILVALLLNTVCYSKGKNSAMRRVIFYQISSLPDRLLVLSEDKKLWFAKYDTTKNILYPDFIICSVDSILGKETLAPLEISTPPTIYKKPE